MSEEIIKVLDELGKRFGIVIDWSNQNIVPYLQELLKRFICYRNVTAGIWIMLSIALIIGGVIMLKFINKWKKSDDYDSSYFSDDDALATVGYILSVCMIALGIIIMIVNALGIAKNIYMPELTAIEYIKNMN